MRRPNGIIFDYGNTLLAEDYFDWLAGMRRMLEFVRGDVKLSAEEILAMHLDLNKEFNQARESSMLEFTFTNYQRFLYGSLGLDLVLGPAEIEREFRRSAQRFQPAPGIHSLMDYLASNGIKAGILSNCPFSGVVMNEDLVKYNLAHYFNFFISSADIGFRKPHPRIFKFAIQKMGLDPSEIWFVGDNLNCDVKGALDSGLFPVWYNCDHLTNDSKYACLEIESWTDLPNVIQTLV